MAESVDTALVQNSLILIENMRTGGDTNVPTFVDIPQIYEDLILIWGGRCDDTLPNSQYKTLGLRFNGDGGTSSYNGGRISISMVSGGFITGNSDWPAGNNGEATAGTYSVLPSGIVGAQASGGWIHIPRYRRAVSKDCYGWGAARGAGYTGSRRYFSANGTWDSVAPITSVRFWPSSYLWAAGMIASLYGTPAVS